MKRERIQFSVVALVALILSIVAVRSFFGAKVASISVESTFEAANGISLSEIEREKVDLVTATVKEGVGDSTIPMGGDLIALPGKSAIVTAPFAGTLKAAGANLVLGSNIEKGQVVFLLTPSTGVQRDLKTTLKAELESALARFGNAKQQLARTRTLFEGKATSKKSLELAEQEEIQAKALHTAAEKRLKTTSANPFDADVEVSVIAPIAGVLKQFQGVDAQTVPAGTPLFEVVDLTALWLRVPIFAGDIDRLRSISEIEIKESYSTKALKALRVSGPLTADPLTSTIDLYFEIRNPPDYFLPGQRLIALIPRHKPKQIVLSIPESSIVYDPSGSEWVYVEENNRFLRVQVDVQEIVDSKALIASGLTPGQVIVEQGAAELLGVEARMNKK